MIWHGAAIFLTFVIVETGLDWKYFLATQTDALRIIFFPAVIIGGLLPMILPIIIFVWAKIKKSWKLEVTAYLLAQAAFLGWLVSSFYKFFTGRIPPPHSFGHVFISSTQKLTDISHGFQFGLGRGGIFWGWPSSHTTVAFSIGLALWQFFPKNKIIRTFALLYSIYVALGVSMSIHWPSEAVAGAIIGSVIGTVVGKSFRDFSENKIKTV